MGANETKIAISETTQYNGQVQDGIPHGNGTILVFSEDSQKKEKRKIEGKFAKGKILEGRVFENNVIYEGPIENEKLTGIGKLIFKQTTFDGQILNGIARTGEISNNEFTCKGNYIELDVSEKYSSSTDESEGMKTLLLEGKSSYYWIEKKENVEGEFNNGEINGKGVYKFNNGDVFEGEFKNGEICGFGTYTSKNNQFNKISSNFYKSKPHCKIDNQTDERIGKIEFMNGDCYEGSLLNGSMHGSSGKYTYSNGTIYEGEFYHNTMTGDCQIKFEPTFEIENYKGEVSEGLFNGLGVVEYRNGIILKGYFLKNKKNGPCIIIYGNRMFKCLFVMDELVGTLTEVPSN